MEHLFGCHGEWMWIGQMLALVPFVGVWVRTCLREPTC